MQSLAGKFLLASRTLLDPNFVRTAVLIVRHDDDGAFGLVVNRPLPVTVSAALSDTIDAAATIDASIYSGGPCDGPVFVAHGDPAIGGDSPVSGVYVTTDRDAIEALMVANAEPLKVFGTYSGWSPSQLEGELEEGSWLICDASAEHVFSTDQDLWTRLTSRTQLGKYIDPNRIPDDPSVN
ncbi:MAG: YqgE/AlgH family protein [Tepidisphaeraceae bacterium]